ncbi:MAG: hypothetical protein IJ439_06795 [Tyzzerella sp.]|nr:hypothetical protein [Tyzzerella sp.]
MVDFTKLKILSEDLKTISRNDTKETPIIESGVFLFISFDLADSTSFKTEHPSLWASVFTNFYGQILEGLGVENYKSPEEGEESNCVRKLWKLIGDEVLLYVRIRKVSDLYAQVSSVNLVLAGLLEKIADKVEKEMGSQGCQSRCVQHCQNVKEVILSTLGIKTTMWLAKCSEDKKENAVNIVYQPLTPTPNTGERLDFLGRDIDEGFRMAKYAVKNKIIVSPLLGWLIWKAAQNDEDKKKIVKSNFKITAFVAMKGVWRNRKVPIIMFHQHFENFKDVLAYDELDLDTYANIKENGFDKFKTDDRFSIDYVDMILENVFRKKEALSLLEELEQQVDIEISLSNTEKMQELHIACIVFNDKNQILVHKDVDRGLEFGCIKKIFGRGTRLWREICKKGYKEKYGIDIVVDENPVPIATYYYERSNALGVILIAKYEDGAEDKEEWSFYTFEQIKETTEKSVDNFRENVERAIKIKEILSVDEEQQEYG